ncbi:MAG: DUF2878 domain-containing protein [Thiobacillaceae bacterium]
MGKPLPVRAPGVALTPHRDAGVPRPAARRALNLLAFQAAWFATVLGAAHGLPWLGPVAVLAAVVLHLAQSTQRWPELRLLSAAFVLGFLFENALLNAGVVGYVGDPVWVPLWMLALWPLFATTLNVSLAWFKSRRGLAMLAGALAGPPAYAGGEALGAIRLYGPALWILAAGWAVTFPLLLAVARLGGADRRTP